MTTHFIVSIDVEEDNQWRRSEDYSLHNIDCLPKFQGNCEKYGIRPSYLITYSVARNNNSANIIKTLAQTSKCEIGAHLHPWFTPPYQSPFLRAAYPHTYPYECPDSLLYKKISNLTNVIQKQIGVEPKSFRAGRYGMDGRAIGYIRKKGYLIDSSVTPYWSWVDTLGTTLGGPDYSNITEHPYYVGRTTFPNPTNTLEGSILEIPITIKKNSIDEVIWLRPFPWADETSLLTIIRNSLQKKELVLNLMFHSSELYVGGSPYSETKDAVMKIERKLKAIFKFVTELEIKSSTFQEFFEQENEKIKKNQLTI